MTDIDLNLETTEDGRMLIQLMGERSDVLFDMDHLLYSSAPLLILVVLLAAMALLVVFLLLPGLFCNEIWRGEKLGYSWEPKPHYRRNMALLVAVVATASVLACIAIYSGWDVRLEKRLDRLDAEIEAIRVRHPEWGLRYAVRNRGHDVPHLRGAQRRLGHPAGAVRCPGQGVPLRCGRVRPRGEPQAREVLDYGGRWPQTGLVGIDVLHEPAVRAHDRPVDTQGRGVRLPRGGGRGRHPLQDGCEMVERCHARERDTPHQGQAALQRRSPGRSVPFVHRGLGDPQGPCHKVGRSRGDGSEGCPSNVLFLNNIET